MARIRTIKPEFFLHEGLAELPAVCRLFFIGLWTLANKEGRLEDRPRRIKASLFPYEEADVDRMLGALDEAGFVHRYEVDGVPLIAIPSFSSHQRPHPREAVEALPAPPSRTQIRPAGKRFSSIPASSTGKEILESGKEILDKGKEVSVSAESGGPPPVQKPEAAGDVDRLQALWNDRAPDDLPRWRDTPEARKKAAKARLKERPLEEWPAVIDRIAASSFCRGRNDRKWRAGPDFLLKPGTATKALEGQYDDPGGYREPVEEIPDESCEVHGCGQETSDVHVLNGHRVCPAHHVEAAVAMWPPGAADDFAAAAARLASWLSQPQSAERGAA